MKTNLKTLKKEFSQKIQLLDKAKIQLKKEFFGIDSVIDEIIENVRSWYTMNSIQEKPAVINLWGLTGTGKTSLIKRLLELINFNNSAYRFDLGEKEGGMSFRDSLSDLCENKDDAPIAIILDEFQHSRTIKSGLMREEIDNDKNRMVWELIDSGKVSYIEWRRGVWSFEEGVIKLQKLLKAGVIVENGIVTAGKEIFIKEMEYSKGKEEILFVEELVYDTILDLAGEALRLDLKSDVRDILLKLNGEETIRFLFKVVTIAIRPTEKSFSQSIIFILGNIDEAYRMSGDYTADISADEFHEMSLKITVPNMKKALRMRFRDEQIARLGNIHIIYPALNSKAYIAIIHLELNKLKVKIKSVFNLNVEFEQSLIEEIYKEGVYPTQGARPLFTTIHQMVKSKISIHINLILEKKLKVDLIKLSVLDGQLVCDFMNINAIQFTYSDKITSHLEILRKPKMDELQAISAVHESGHAILSAILMNSIPEIVVSVTSDSDNHGFIFTKTGRNYFGKNELLSRIAMNLGGIVAEEIIFGEENVTAGSSSDISHATSLISNMLKSQGFGSIAMQYASHINQESSGFHNISKIEDEMKDLMIKAKILAKETLNKEKMLLLVLSNYLSKNPRIEKIALTALIEEHAVTQISTVKTEYFYRDKLKMQLQTTQVLTKTMSSNPLILNKEK